MDGARDFRLMKRSMVDAIVSMSEYNRFSKGIFGWIGFRTCWLPYKNIERVAGETKWNFWKLFKYAVSGIINFSQVPLTIASWFGTTMTGFSFLVLVAIIVRKLIFDDPVPGWASHHLCHHLHRRPAAFLPGYHGTIHSQNLYGGQAAPPLHHSRVQQKGLYTHTLIFYSVGSSTT